MVDVVEEDLGVCAPCKLGKMTRHPHFFAKPNRAVEGYVDLLVYLRQNNQTFTSHHTRRPHTHNVWKEKAKRAGASKSPSIT